MRELIHALQCNLWCLQVMQSKRIWGKPVLVCILTRSLGFHAVTLECSSFREKPTHFFWTSIWRWICGIFCGAIDDWWSEMARGLADRQTHTSTTVTLAVHARWGLMFCCKCFSQYWQCACTVSVKVIVSIYLLRYSGTSGKLGLNTIQMLSWYPSWLPWSPNLYTWIVRARKDVRVQWVSVHARTHMHTCKNMHMY